MFNGVLLYIKRGMNSPLNKRTLPICLKLFFALVLSTDSHLLDLFYQIKSLLSMLSFFPKKFLHLPHFNLLSFSRLYFGFSAESDGLYLPFKFGYREHVINN